MSVLNSAKSVSKVLHKEPRLECIRPFAKKFQYQQLPLPEPPKPAEKVQTVSAAEKLENQV
jgi:hypothetical protein